MAKGESPLKQFEIKPLLDLELFGYDISFTNSSNLIGFASDYKDKKFYI